MNKDFKIRPSFESSDKFSEEKMKASEILRNKMQFEYPASRVPDNNKSARIPKYVDDDDIDEDELEEIMRTVRLKNKRKQKQQIFMENGSIADSAIDIAKKFVLQKSTLGKGIGMLASQTGMTIASNLITNLTGATNYSLFDIMGNVVEKDGASVSGALISSLVTSGLDNATSGLYSKIAGPIKFLASNSIQNKF